MTGIDESIVRTVVNLFQPAYAKSVPYKTQMIKTKKQTTDEDIEMVAEIAKGFL